MRKALITLPPQDLAVVFPWLKERMSPYVFIAGMLIGQFFHNLMLNFVAKFAEKHNIEGSDFDDMFTKFATVCHAEGRNRAMASMQRELDSKESKLSASEKILYTKVIQEVKQDPNVDPKQIVDKIRAEMRNKRVCNVCEKSDENLLLCSRCVSVYYCSKEHQQQDWFAHKAICRPLNLKVKESAPKE